MKLADDLRRAVLQAAIQGNLTQQLESDGTAEDLLKGIRAEKEKMIAEGEIKREKPLKPITDDEKPFDIPESWVWERWGNVSFSIQYGYNAPALEYGSVKMVRISDIQNNKIQWATVPYCEISDTEMQNYLLAKNDILFARTGGTVGKSYLVNDIPERVIYAGYLIRTRFSTQINPQYMKFFMESSLYWTQLRNGTTATAQPNCNGKTLSNMVIPLPPLAEQHRIVERIDALMSKIDELAEAENELEAMKQKFPGDLRDSLLQAAIQGKLTHQLDTDGTAEDLLKEIRKEKERLISEGKIKREKELKPITDEEKPFDIPESWEWVRLGEIFQHNTGKALNSSDMDGTPLEYITTSNLYWNKFDLTKLKTMLFTEAEVEKCTVCKGDLLVLEGGDVGRTAIWNYDFPMRIQNHIHRLRAYGEVCIEYFYHVFFIYKHSSFINGKGIGIQGLSSNVLHSLAIPIPPLAEQKRIVKRLNELLPLCEAMKVL